MMMMNGHGGDKVNGHVSEKCNGHDVNAINGHDDVKMNGHASGEKGNDHNTITFHNMNGHALKSSGGVAPTGAATVADLEPYTQSAHRLDLESPPKIPKKLALKT